MFWFKANSCRPAAHQQNTVQFTYGYLTHIPLTPSRRPQAVKEMLDDGTCILYCFCPSAVFSIL